MTQTQESIEALRDACKKNEPLILSAELTGVLNAELSYLRVVEGSSTAIAKASRDINESIEKLNELKSVRVRRSRPGILTRRAESVGALADLRAMYRDCGDHVRANGRTPAEIVAALDALGANPAPVEVDRVMGHNGWVQVHCRHCDKHVEALVYFGEDAICRDCMVAIVAQVDATLEAE